MHQRIARLAVVAVLVLGLAAAGLFIYSREARRDQQLQALRVVDEASHSIVVDTLELRAAQQAYVAAGQGEGYWGARAASSIQALTDALLRLRQLTDDATAQSAVDGASEQVVVLQDVERRARDYARTDQRLMASDLIFTDGLEATRGLIERVNAARTRHREVAEATVQDTRRAQLLAFAAAVLLAGALAGTLALTPGRQDQTEAMALAEPSRGQGLEMLSARAPAASAGRPAPTHDQAAGATDAAHLAAVADLCTEFARVIDPGELPGLLQRSAKILEATGLIVWMADSSTAALRPAIAHGYSAQALNMMGTLPRDGDNATSAAYRDARLRTVSGEAGRMAALVAPLMSATGCVGVMAIEVPAGHEARPATQALAAIVAAQLAALVAMPAAEALPAGRA